MYSNYRSSLEAGLVSLNQGNFQEAISILRVVITETEVISVRLKACIVLIIAYVHTGNVFM